MMAMRVVRPTTRPRRRAVRTLLVLAGCCLALLLSACSSVTFQSTFDKDGTARHQVTFVFDRDNLLPADISRIELGLNSAMTRATNDGFAVQRISTSSEIGLRVMGNSIDATDTHLCFFQRAFVHPRQEPFFDKNACWNQRSSSAQASCACSSLQHRKPPNVTKTSTLPSLTRSCCSLQNHNILSLLHPFGEGMHAKIVGIISCSWMSRGHR